MENRGPLLREDQMASVGKYVENWLKKSSTFALLEEMKIRLRANFKTFLRNLKVLKLFAS